MITEYVYTCTLAIDLRDIEGYDGGLYQAVDNGYWYYWSPLSTAVDDGVNVLKYTGSATGRWLKQPLVITNPDLPNSGVVAGSYGYVTVNSKGIVTAGKRLELYSGTTNGSGIYTVTFSTPYSTTPNIQASITNQSSTNQTIRVSSVSTTGFTVHVFARGFVNLLGIDVLLSAVTNVSGATIDVLVTEK